MTPNVLGNFRFIHNINGFHVTLSVHKTQHRDTKLNNALPYSGCHYAVYNSIYCYTGCHKDTQHNNALYFDECHYAMSHFMLDVIMLSVIMLIVVAPPNGISFRNLRFLMSKN
jgi:hypothetical protein